MFCSGRHLKYHINKYKTLLESHIIWDFLLWNFNQSESIIHLEFPNVTKITNNVQDHQSNIFTNFGSICSSEFWKLIEMWKVNRHRQRWQYLIWSFVNIQLTFNSFPIIVTVSTCRGKFVEVMMLFPDINKLIFRSTYDVFSFGTERYTTQWS
jgi:hypothetical protein